ncbi:hypothetical protein AOLI_G00144040 [Acnodon oligacanthus]
MHESAADRGIKAEFFPTTETVSQEKALSQYSRLQAQRRYYGRMRVAAFIRSRRFGAESSAAVLYKYQINKKLERRSERGDNTAKRRTLQKNEGLSIGFTSLHR